MVTMKNILGVIGLAVIALFWVFITNIYGALFVAALIVLVVVVLRYQQRRKRPPSETKADETAVR